MGPRLVGNSTLFVAQRGPSCVATGPLLRCNGGPVADGQKDRFLETVEHQRFTEAFKTALFWAKAAVGSEFLNYSAVRVHFSSTNKVFPFSAFSNF